MKKNKTIGITFEALLAFIKTNRDCNFGDDFMITELEGFCEKQLGIIQHWREHDNCIALIDGLIKTENLPEECQDCQQDKGWCPIGKPSA